MRGSILPESGKRSIHGSARSGCRTDPQYDSGELPGCYGDTGHLQSCDQPVVVHTSQRRMSLARWSEVSFYAEMDLNRSAPKPAATSFRQLSWLRDFHQPQ